MLLLNCNAKSRTFEIYVWSTFMLVDMPINSFKRSTYFMWERLFYFCYLTVACVQKMCGYWPLYKNDRTYQKTDISVFEICWMFICQMVSLAIVCNRIMYWIDLNMSFRILKNNVRVMKHFSRDNSYFATLSRREYYARHVLPHFAFNVIQYILKLISFSRWSNINSQ